jgi:hypothetical protein
MATRFAATPHGDDQDGGRGWPCRRFAMKMRWLTRRRLNIAMTLRLVLYIESIGLTVRAERYGTMMRPSAPWAPFCEWQALQSPFICGVSMTRSSEPTTTLAR